ncbi:SDR family oxidoreductase [Nocardioides sp. zg-1228]|uniref:SDR family NAD(P)-dependent oxidoreductase n=1 Tax=Nocardioides sp. zg-1228 TaxID=2763008 RepID=UPI0016423F2B|nr:SDR family NAD(P)-dependent oxidoreductase [Nocardioides sp. zg-1228]MBC2931469.1 SDR family oxidoreductase [Nocardioides sp. zg-1228]QSF57077.1 SDR family oxidoreductase [Nocardioides sp. zg-1228]
MSLSTVADKVIVITGAGSGIGRALALRCARAGALLALADWDAGRLAETVGLVREAGATTVCHDLVDVSDRAAVAAWASAVVERLGRVDLVVNNAGVTATGDFTDLTYDDLDWIVGVNFYGVVHGSKEFLPHLIASGNGALVNISSLFGLVSAPGQSAYNATKYAVRGLTEAIREEMLIAGHPVTVTCVHPGGIRTGISRHGRKAAGLDGARIDALFDDRLARMSPDRAAEIILAGALAGKPRVLVGLDAHVIHHAARLLGARYQDVVARLHRRAGAS